MSRLEISARWPGLGSPCAAARSLASSTVVGDLSVASPFPTDWRCLALVAITPPVMRGRAARRDPFVLRPAEPVSHTGIREDAPPRPTIGAPHGAIAQLGERLPCKQEVAGSNPAGSIIPRPQLTAPARRGAGGAGGGAP